MARKHLKEVTTSCPNCGCAATILIRSGLTAEAEQAEVDATREQLRRSGCIRQLDLFHTSH